MLGPSEGHHLVDVLRLGPGDLVVVFDGEGREATARIVSAGGNDRGVVLAEEETLATDQSTTEVILVVALPKGKRMDVVVEKGTEMGVSAIWPVLTDRVVARPDAVRSRQRAERWRRIAQSAAKQCCRARVPDVREPAPLADVLPEAAACDLLLVGSLAADAVPLRQAVAGRRAGSPRTVAMLIGPEGDLTEVELQSALEAGAVPVSFGSTTLRVETAALFACAVLVYEFS